MGVVSKLLSLAEVFKGRHFDAEIIVLCVRWYLQYKLSYRDLAEMMAERGVSVAPSTILRWVQHYAPEFEKRWNRFARPVGGSWRWMRRTSRFVAAGCTSIAPWMLAVRRSTFA
jgi:transposase-like protein